MTNTMTKKEAKAAEVLANKRAAYTKRVADLLGPIAFIRVRKKEVDINAAFEAGVDANTFAATVAALEPVGAAIWPQKVDAMQYAEDMARDEIERVKSDLEEAGWDIHAVAPYPWGNRYDEKAIARYHLFNSLTTTAGGIEIRGKPHIVKMYDKGIEHHISHEVRQAGNQYDAFVLKMVHKCGEVIAATLTGSHIWSHSILTVTKTDGTTERWHTQQIVNYSKYGRPFYQWPSRKMK